MTQRPVYLNGRFVTTPDSFEVIDPATGTLLGLMSSTGAEGADGAIADAEKAFRPWRELTALTRAEYLVRISELLLTRIDEIAAIITRENGKPLAQSTGEVRMAADHFRWFAEEGRRAYGRVIPNQAEGKRHLVIKSPIGVVAAVTPWNFPLVLAARKVAPALAAGCPAILRPATKTPFSAVALAECVHEAGVPSGVFQLLAGPAEAIAGRFLSNPLCRKITFTGSTEVGKRLIRGSAESVTSLSLELGGHAPVLVFPDTDIELAVEGSLVTKFRNTGQSCIAANRILVHRDVYESFTEQFTASVTALKVGNGFEPGIDIGPMIDGHAFETAMAHIDEAIRGGAELLCGGRRADIPGGFFLEPTVLGRVPASAVCMREETFAPVAPIGVFDTEEEAISMANATEYGLAAYAYTSNLSRAFRLMEAIDAGTIGINDAVPSTSQCPFGGSKQSGIGRELGTEGLDAFLETRHVSLGGIA